MKHSLVVAMVVFLLAALNSCDTTDPASAPEGTGDVELDKAKCGGVMVLAENIPFAVIEPNPLASSQFAFIIGRVTYGVAPSPIFMRDMVSVSLDLSAELHPLNGTDQLWLFTGKSTDLVELSNGGPAFLTKEYRTIGQPITLTIRFEITSCKVTIDEMSAVRDGGSAGVPTDS